MHGAITAIVVEILEGIGVVGFRPEMDQISRLINMEALSTEPAVCCQREVLHKYREKHKYIIH